MHLGGEGTEVRCWGGPERELVDGVVRLMVRWEGGGRVTRKFETGAIVQRGEWTGSPLEEYGLSERASEREREEREREGGREGERSLSSWPQTVRGSQKTCCLGRGPLVHQELFPAKCTSNASYGTRHQKCSIWYQ
jgi:hypothetical protein